MSRADWEGDPEKQRAEGRKKAQRQAALLRKHVTDQPQPTTTKKKKKKNTREISRGREEKSYIKTWEEKERAKNQTWTSSVH